MTERERLIELLECDVSHELTQAMRENLADYLLSNGVVVLPCRCCECEYHDHDGGTGYCNYWRRWSNMSDYCNHGKRNGEDTAEWKAKKNDY